jgi:CBS domain-containing protein
MRVKDLMTTPVQVIRQDARIEAAADLLAARNVTALPVVNADDSLVGMVSEGDLLWHRVPADPASHVMRDLNEQRPVPPSTVHQIMAAHPVTVTPDADVADAADLMLQHDVRSIPVVEGRKVVGIVSRRDILRVAIRDDDTLTGEVQHRLDEYAGTPGRWHAAVHRGVATVQGAYQDDTERTVVAVLARTVPGISAVELVRAPAF